MRLSDVSALTEIGLEDCADRVQELEGADFVLVDRDRISITHQLFRSALYRHLGNASRAFIHGRIAAHLEATEPGDIVGELAIHYSRAGESEAAARYGRIAAEESMASGAIAAAEYFFGVVVNNESDPTLRPSHEPLPPFCRGPCPLAQHNVDVYGACSCRRKEHEILGIYLMGVIHDGSSLRAPVSPTLRLHGYGRRVRNGRTPCLSIFLAVTSGPYTRVLRWLRHDGSVRDGGPRH